MGISGLIPFLKKASRPANVSEFSGCTVAIDVYCWLHKGAFGCAEKLVQEQSTNGYVKYVMKYLDMLQHHRITPILVFDGRNLPSKANTEKKRREQRDKYRKLAKHHLIQGNLRQATECFQRCVDITPHMAREVIEACRQRLVDCLVAPYEADAQLAFLSRNGFVHLVISEDSDLVPFGCSKVLFKMDASGNGVLFDGDQLNMCLGYSADNFTLDKFRHMCIMAGCDYLPSLTGIGIGKACKFFSRITNPDLRAVLPKIPSYLNMPALKVPDDYVDAFVKADRTFCFQLVFDPKERKLRPLTDYPSNLDKADLAFAGEYVDPELALQMAIGNVDIHTLKQVGHWNPDECEAPSIWCSSSGGRAAAKPTGPSLQETFFPTLTPQATQRRRLLSPSPPTQKKPNLSAKRLKMDHDSMTTAGVDNADDDNDDNDERLTAFYSIKQKEDPAPVSETSVIFVSKYFTSTDKKHQKRADLSPELLSRMPSKVNCDDLEAGPALPADTQEESDSVTTKSAAGDSSSGESSPKSGCLGRLDRLSCVRPRVPVSGLLKPSKSKAARQTNLLDLWAPKAAASARRQ